MRGGEPPHRLKGRRAQLAVTGISGRGETGAALGPNAPVPPGISKLPGPGQYYASSALAALLHTVPADELGDRFRGRLAGIIGNAALTGPGELVIFVGYTPAALKTERR